MGLDAGEVVRAVAKMTDINGSLIENVYHWYNSGSIEVPSVDLLNAIEARLSTAYANIESHMPDTLTPLEIACDIVDFVGGVLKVVGPIGDIAWTNWAGGTSSGDGLPQGAAAVVNFPTLESGVQGRKYMGPLSEGSQNNGILTSTAQTNLGLFGDDVRAILTVSAQNLLSCLMSTKFDNFRTLAGVIVPAVIGYQRRRKSGVGA